MTEPAGARFDDLRAGRAVAFDAPDRVLVAHTPAEVPAVLAAVDAATAGGAWAYGYLAYEAAGGLDPDLVTHAPEPDGPPVAWFGITGAPRPVPLVEATGAPAGTWAPPADPDTHAAQVARIREHIAAGLTYQTNLTARVDGRVDLTADPDLGGLYGDLAAAQGGAHHALLDLGRFVIASASPELFVHRDSDVLTLRPMKGTAARGRTTAEDHRLATALVESAKERAENVMIVDLMRHDVSRLAVDGSVRVRSLFRPERYATVWQLTSEITARTRPGTDLFATMRALFPCGSVTGAPKGSTMRLIAEVEDCPRGVYCGTIGWVGPGTARFAVAIRTVVADRATGHAVYGTGGGITWGSDPAAEYAELLAKTRVLTHRRPAFALLETFGVRDGRPRHLDRHLARLADSAAYFGIDDAAVRPALDARLADVRDARVRVVLHRDGSVEITLGSLPDSDPVLVAPPDLDDPVDDAEPWPHHKTTRREPYDRRLESARRAHPTCDDVILTNSRGELTETTVANLALQLDGVWCTPELGGGALPGVERADLVDRGVLVPRTLYPADLHRADALAVISSLRGWRPARLLSVLSSARADGTPSGAGRR